MSRRRERRWKSGPVMASVLLHGAVAGLLAFSGGEAPEPPKTKIYAVDIVSSPPTMAGAPPTEALSNQEPGPAASPAPAPAAETPAAPEPDPAPPAPEPDPAPPRAEPKEPAKVPGPRRTPPERPVRSTPRPPTPRPSTPRPPTPAPEKNRPAPAPATNRPPATPEKNRPASPATGTNRPAATPEKNRPAGGSSTTGGSGTGSTRTRGDGTSTAPATGSNPQANSPGGEGLNIHVEGEPCPVAGYCERVTLQVQRYFRAPPDNAGARGEVCFRIQRDGSVTDIQAQRVRGGGGAAFRLAMMEAAEAAGSRRAFGTLPGPFDPQRWRWCVELSPR
jgi:hypothetical protein